MGAGNQPQVFWGVAGAQVTAAPCLWQDCSAHPVLPPCPHSPSSRRTRSLASIFIFGPLSQSLVNSTGASVLLVRNNNNNNKRNYCPDPTYVGALLFNLSEPAPHDQRAATWGGRAGPAGLARGSPGRRGRARLGRRSPGGRQRAPRVPQSGAGRSLRRGREGRGCHVLGAERRAGSAARASAPRVAAERGSWRRPALRTLLLSRRCPALPVPRENATPSKGARRPRSRPLVPGEAGGCGRRREGAAGSAGTEHGASPRCPGGAAGQRDRLPGGITSCGLGLRALRPAAGAPRMSPESLGRRRAGAEPGAGRDRRQAGGREGGTEPPPGHAAGAGWQLPGSAAEKLTRKITAPKTRRRLSGSVCCCFFLFHVLNFGSQSQVQLCRETTETCV